VEGKIRSKELVVSEGGLFTGQADIDLDDASGEADGSAFPEDELRTSYEESARRAAEWYRSSLDGPRAEPDRNGAREPDATGTSEPEETTPIGATPAALPEADPERIDGSRGRRNPDVARWAEGRRYLTR
jgi:hypothetical protein